MQFTSTKQSNPCYKGLASQSRFRDDTFLVKRMTRNNLHSYVMSAILSFCVKNVLFYSTGFPFGRYVPRFWTANTEFAYKKAKFDYKMRPFEKFCRCWWANSQTKSPQITRAAWSCIWKKNVAVLIFTMKLTYCETSFGNKP